MTLTYFYDHLFDVLNEDDELNVQDIRKIDSFSYLIITKEGERFLVRCERAE